MAHGAPTFVLLAFLCTSISLTAQAKSPETDEENHGARIRYALESDDSYIFTADNPFFIPYTLRLGFPVLENMVASVPLPLELVIPPGAKDLPVLTLKAGPGSSTGFVSDPVFTLGDAIHARADLDFAYLFPFAHGSKFVVSQGFNGRYTHTGQNQYAVDFSMPEGTPVCAARGGIVAEVKSDSDRGGPGSEFDSYGNYLSIWQEDGTFGTYFHLKKDGALVKPGDRVSPGQTIGYSGSTGRSSGPHLHFDVRLPVIGGKTRSIPMKFLDIDGKTVEPQEHAYYFSTHPGMEDFNPVLGRNLKNSDFAAYVAHADKANTVHERYEQVDDTVVVFLANGFSREVTVELDFRLENYLSTMGKKFTLKIPSGSEVFATLLNPLEPGKPGTWSVKFRY